MATYYASGLLLGAETVVGTASDVVDALIQVQLSGIGTSDRAMARRAIAIAVAQELQGDILTAAAKAGLLSSANVSDLELERLKRSKAIADDFAPWLSTIDLILVEPAGPWTYPGGQCLVIRPTTDHALVVSLMLTMWLRVERIG